jgi:hypothetical protein
MAQTGYEGRSCVLPLIDLHNAVERSVNELVFAQVGYTGAASYARAEPIPIAMTFPVSLGSGKQCTVDRLILAAKRILRDSRPDP